MPAAAVTAPKIPSMPTLSAAGPQDRTLLAPRPFPAGRGDLLDYGSGDRPYEEIILTRFDRYIAADMKEANLSHPLRPDIYIDGPAIDLPSSSVDCVILTEVLEHLSRSAEPLVELQCILEPGGSILSTTPLP